MKVYEKVCFRYWVVATTVPDSVFFIFYILTGSCLKRRKIVNQKLPISVRRLPLFGRRSDIQRHQQSHFAILAQFNDLVVIPFIQIAAGQLFDQLYRFFDINDKFINRHDFTDDPCV